MTATVKAQGRYNLRTSKGTNPTDSKMTSPPSRVTRSSSNSATKTSINYSLGSIVSGLLGLSRSPTKQEESIYSSVVSLIQCSVCLEDKLLGSNSTFTTESCNHPVCRDCIRLYYSNALKDNRYNSGLTRIQCPSSNCQGNYNTNELIGTIFNKNEVDEWWRAALAKTHILNKVICPLGDCKAIFDANLKDIKQCTFTECYECHRGFCMACQQKWHPGVIKIYSDEQALRQTLKHAATNNWSRCPNCNNLVERSAGCIDIVCRCGKNFCYRCGGNMTSHNVCARACGLLNPVKLASIRQSMFNYNPTTFTA